MPMLQGAASERARIVVFVFLAGLLASGTAFAVTITEFPLPSAGCQPSGITTGPDGNLWFTEQKANKIGRVTPAGVVTEFPVPTADSHPLGIAWGPDGSLWFTEWNGEKIGRITRAGVVTEFTTPTRRSGPSGITAGPDGNLWFTEMSSGKIGRITTAGVITEFPLPASPGEVHPDGITAGPDGNLWFTERVRNRIGRITTAGVITEFPIPTADCDPNGIAVGPDGNLWFTELRGNKIGRISATGTVTEYPLPTANADPMGITAGPDGNLWFTEFKAGKVGRITTAGVVTEFQVPRYTGGITRITTGPDGNLWYTYFYLGFIGRITTTDQLQSWVLPSSAYSKGAKGEEYHTDVRLLNLGPTSVTVTATFFDQASGQTKTVPAFPVAAGNQAAYDNVLKSLFGRDLGVYGPIRFQSTGPIVVSSSVNNVNACGTGGVSGQWLPGIDSSQAVRSGALTQLALSTSSGSGYRTNVVFMNPGTSSATVTARLRRGGGSQVGTMTIGPLPANGFRQVALSTFPGASVLTDTNLWLEFTSDAPVLSFASVIHNVSGDPFAIVATPK